MKFEELIVLLPCHSLEDFPTHYEGAAAEGLLAAWSALWHPALLASAGRAPTWHRADGPPDNLANRLVIIPGTSEASLLAGWPQRATGEGALVLQGVDQRDRLVEAALAALDPPSAPISTDLAADFLALGYCYLTVELLTRQMRYVSGVDEVQLENEVLAAARACVAGDRETTRTHLTNCFESLREARDRFYPVDCYLIDLTLVAETTMGQRLRDELSGDVPRNLLVTGELIAKMASDEPSTLADLRLAIDQKRACLVGGAWRDEEWPLAPLESILADLRRGACAFREHLGQMPSVFGRRRFGLSPLLPQVLSRLGYLGSLHFTLDDGRFPTGSQSKIAWEGLGSATIDALARLPLDAAAAGSFLALSRVLGESMDRDHVATVVLAHWPGQRSSFYEDLRRATAYAPVLGKFMSLEEYFSHTTRPGELTRFKADQYRSPYLRQAVARGEPDPISRFVDRHADRARQYVKRTIGALVELLGSPAGTTCATASHGADDAAARQLAAVLAGSADGASAQIGCLAVNPHSFAQRCVIDVSSLERLPDCEGPVTAVQESGGRKLAVADLPGTSFAWIGAGTATPARTRKKPPRPLAAGSVLENEHMKVILNEATGAIQSIHDYVQRYNRLSAQLAFRMPGPKPRPGDMWQDPDEQAAYSVMAADTVEVTQAGPAVGEIASRGRLLDQQGRQLAGYTQRHRLARGSRVLEWELELDIEQLPQGDPWESYYAARFAWRDDFAELWHDVGLASQRSEARRVEAPHLVELRTDRLRTTILTHGLCFHRRSGERMLDTLLVVQGETRRRFRLATGIDQPYPIQSAMALLHDAVVVGRAARPAGGSSTNWLFHMDARNVIATHWEALQEDGHVAGYRVRLLETAGRGGRVKLRSFRSLSAARQVDLQGQTLAELPVERDCVTIDFAPHEWNEIEARW